MQITQAGSRLVAAVGALLHTARARRAAATALAAMSDGELADISISRCDVTRLFDPEFAPEYAARRPARPTILSYNPRSG